MLVRGVSLFLRAVFGILPVMFFQSVHTFVCFLKSIWSDFGHAETAGSGAEMRVVLRRKIFCSNFKV